MADGRWTIQGRDQGPVLLALLAITALAWGYVIWLGAQMATATPAAMAGMPGMDMSAPALAGAAFRPWTYVHFLFIFSMWAVMMVGMMTPAVTPMVLMYARIVHASAGRRPAPAAWFACGYLCAWIVFSALAAYAQWGLEALALLTPMMTSASHRFGGAMLIAAGIYQWLPVKDACLSQCRAPLQFLQRHGGFQPGAAASLRLGFLHGLHCVGCCWVLMTLLFVVGVMNLLWIAALMVFVLLERLIRGGRILSWWAGAAAVLAGLWMYWV
jgi:predicted metal-binding membrane protein